MEEVDTQELPIIAAALTDLEYRDPFLLTVLAGKQSASATRLAEGRFNVTYMLYVGLDLTCNLLLQHWLLPCT